MRRRRLRRRWSSGATRWGSGPGIHHVAVRVEDIRAALARLKARGARLIDDEPRAGAGGCLVAFVHPQSAGGVLLELVEHSRAEGGAGREGHRA
ncbi:MAG: VOC family protein [Acidobacteria bacterium]|nr:VOC family protein [Acidobacteriota bacterium]